MKKILLAATIVVGLASAAGAEEKRLVTVVTSPEPQTQLMAMVLTMQAAQKGAQVRVLLCGSGGDIALEQAPESATAPQPPRGMSPQGLMQSIMAAGGRVEVCAIYLPGRGIGADMLIKGVGVAQPPEMAEAMLAEKTVVWSF
ncbi:MAG: DsrE family protein [Gammaproteobacteria bacterium]|nr:DsrE family protein [Gammaproteobacteria bacterium]